MKPSIRALLAVEAMEAALARHDGDMHGAWMPAFVEQVALDVDSRWRVAGLDRLSGKAPAEIEIRDEDHLNALARAGTPRRQS